jgi:hypothetical protein
MVFEGSHSVIPATWSGWACVISTALITKARQTVPKPVGFIHGQSGIHNDDGDGAQSANAVAGTFLDSAISNVRVPKSNVVEISDGLPQYLDVCRNDHRFGYSGNGCVFHRSCVLFLAEQLDTHCPHTERVSELYEQHHGGFYQARIAQRASVNRFDFSLPQ